MVLKKEVNTENMLQNVGILYDRLILNLKSETIFLKNQLLAKGSLFRDEITFLHRKLSEVLAKQVNTSAYPSSSTVTVNVDEPPVKEDQANPKSEKIAVGSDSKKKKTKEKPNTETKDNSKTNNNVERQKKRQKRKIKVTPE